MGVTLSGFDDLAEALTRLSQLGKSKAINDVLRRAAEPIVQQATANAPGSIAKAIRAGDVTFKKGVKKITIGVHRKDWHEDEYIPPYVEYGHGGPRPAPPHPFLRPAYDARVDEAYSIVKEGFNEEISKIL